MDERRQHRRLVIRLPVECHAPGDSPEACIRATSSNISTGGIYFEIDLTGGVAAPVPPAMLDIDLTIPPGDGHFPYESRISSTVEVLRCEPLARAGAPVRSAAHRLGVAARFRESLKYEF